VLSFYGLLALPPSEESRLPYVAMLYVISYGIIVTLFFLHIHRQFPSLWPRIYEKISTIRDRCSRKSKSGAVSEPADHPTVDYYDYSSPGIVVNTPSKSTLNTPTTLPMTQLSPPETGDDITPQFRESLLADDL